MNRVTPQTPLGEVEQLIRRDGYVLMENALEPARLAEIRRAYDEQLGQNPPAEGALRIEVTRILERDPVFEQLMDHPPVFAAARAMIGADIELATGGELDHKFANTPAYIGWHNDFQWMTDVPYPRQNFWIRCIYFVDDVTADMGPFTLLPGTHRADQACPRDWRDDQGQPMSMDGAIGITGPAGSCLINNTEIWHTNTPNCSDHDRRLIMVLYKHAWMKQWQEGSETSAEFAARQTDPLRRQLCGSFPWNHGAEYFPAHAWQPPGVEVPV